MGLPTFIAAFAWLSSITITITVVTFIFATQKKDSDFERKLKTAPLENIRVITRVDLLPTYEQGLIAVANVGPPPTYKEAQALLVKNSFITKKIAFS